MPARRSFRIVPLAALWALAACAPTIPKEALQLSPESLQDRQAQTRRFDTGDEAMLLSASAALLQDLGFNLDESETKLGVLVASKDRDAQEVPQRVLQFVLAVGLGVYVPVEKNQKIRASVATRPAGETAKSTAVRVTFQRIVWNEQNQITRQERLNDPAAYQEFFDKLSKAVFLEAHQL